MKKSLFILLLLGSTFVIAQENIKVMHYNLLFYGKNNSYCTTSNNNIDHKNEQLKTILSYVQPDILCVNEMDASASDVNYLMNNTLNINGIDYWQHATVSGSYLINMIYYNADKMDLVSEESINGKPRETNVYHFESTSNPEIKWTIFIVHLKAGYGDESEEKRTYSTEKIMNYLQNRDIDNYIITGDFNTYRSSEESFQNLINPSNSNLAFNDPVNRLGNWTSNSSFSDVHTQSTHSSSESCFSYGGIDDRFDFILISNSIKDGNNMITYENNSYETIGQDGNHYNESINSGNNNSAPSNVIDALYEMSDHLPVSLNLILDNQSSPSTTLFDKDFNDQDLNSGGWSSYSVADDERTWHVPSSTYGNNNSYCAKISGWNNANTTSVENEDWLISPSFNANNFSNLKLHFWTAEKYNGNDLEVLYSTNYSGSNNPNNASWTQLNGYTLSTTGNFTWKPSEYISLSYISGENVYIAFKYTSSASADAKTWEVDDIKLTYNNGISDGDPLKKLNIYPNPIRSTLIIDIEELQLIDTNALEIYNSLGIKVMTYTLTNTKTSINLESIKSGMYFAKLGDAIQKFIIVE